MLRATLLVNDLAARGFLGGRQIVFRTQDRPLEVQRYNLFLWEEPPGRAIAGNLARALRTANLFEFVIRPAQRSRADLILGGELTRFEHLPTAGPPRVEADFSLTLVRGADRRSLFSRRYRGSEAVRAATPEAMARAFNRLASRLIDDAVRDLRSLGPRLSASAGRR
jgi:cholesterol transport system auxiliary component